MGKKYDLDPSVKVKQNLNDYVTTGFFLFNTCDFTEFLQLAVLSKKKWAIDQGEEIYLNTL
jgi:hypothetical protein